MNSLLSAFFKFGRQRGWLPKDHDITEDMPRFDGDPKDTIEIYTPDEVARLLGGVRNKLLPYLAVGAFAGLRSAEISRLDWSEIHMDQRFIEMRPSKSKTASRRLIPICDALAAWLFPFVQESGPVCDFVNVPKQLARLSQDSGVPWKKNALRHSWISYRLAQIQNAAQVALEAGNSPAMIFAHYRELVTPTQAAAWFSIRPESPANVVPMPTAATA